MAAVVLLFLVASVVGPLLVLRRRDRLEERALAIRAKVAYVVNRALGGESLVAVNVNAPRPWRPGRVQLTVPPGHEWLLEKVAAIVLSHVPPDFELVIPPESRVHPLRQTPAPTLMSRSDGSTRAA